jgi:type VI secretion system secreted protein Hcp
MRSTRPSRTGRRIIATTAAVLMLVGVAIGLSTRGTEAPQSREVSFDAALAAFGTASNYYLKIPGIPGDSTSSTHANEIDVETFSWGLTNTTGTAAITNLTVSKYIDPASPLLMKATALGTTFTSIVLTADKTGSTPFRYVTLTLSNAKLKSFKETGSRATGILENITFSYTQARLRYTSQSSTGGIGPSVEACFDFPSRTVC